MRVKIYFRQNEGDQAKLLSPLDIEEDASLHDLRSILQNLNVFKRLGEFQFWDVQEGCRIDVDFETLNSVRECVHLIPEQPSELGPSKRPRLGNAPVGVESVGTVDADEETNAAACLQAPFTTENCDADPPLPSTSEEHSGTDGPALKSTLLPADVALWYTNGEDKLRGELKLVSMEDHGWSLRSWDQGGAPVVKLYCNECRNFIGGSTGKHTKNTVTNLFSNFRKSHLNSNGHIRNYCRQRGVEFANHPQAGTTRANPVTITGADHKRLVEEGIGVMDTVNDSIDSSKPTFQLVGDPDEALMKSYWFKVKCLVCPREVFQLCPPKHNLEVNLMNHVHGILHTKAQEELSRKGAAGSALSTGKRGRPPRSTASSGESSQKGLHFFFKHTEGELHPHDKSSLQTLMCWGLRGPHCVYGGKSYGVDGLLFDPHPGKVWYAEAYLEALFQVGDHVVIVKGAFRHRDCTRVSISGEPFQNFTCSKCCSIVLEPDFRSRVVREERAVEKRGFRGTGLGCRAGYLSVFELCEQTRKLKKQHKLEKMQHWSAKVRIAQLKVSRPTLRQSAQGATDQHNVYKFCTDIISAHRTGVMGGKPALWDFLRDVASNLNRKKQGIRWSTNSKAFSQAMKMYGGRRMCELFSLNYCGPNYSTTKRENQKGVQFVPGEHADIFKSVAEIYKNAKHAHGIVGPVPVILAEDETKVKGRVAWDHRWDTLVGFCGPVDNHVCEPNYKELVGTGNEGYTKIVDSFRTNRIGAFARVVMVNPLHRSLPRLALVVTCTCNCFDATWVREQWNRIEELWNKECAEIVGPIVGHASDGDSRRRQLMLADYTSGAGSRGSINWEGWLLTTSVDTEGKWSGLHDQDWIHNGKKLINPLDSPVKTLQLGEDGAFHTHLGMLYNKYTFDDHGLKLEDVQRKDRQNWASAQRMCQRKTQQCLARMRNSGEAHRERTLGTEMYLQVCGDYIDMFASEVLDLRSRIVLAAKVSFFFRIWKLWFSHGNHAVGNNSVRFTAKESFVSQQCFLDVQVSCHFVVLLVKMFRDRYSHLPVPLDLTGSDSCEIFFSKIGGMNGMERCYDFHDLLNTANTLNRLSSVEYGENGVQFGRVHNKVENIWATLHPLLEGETPADLGDYSLIATDFDVIAALKEGLKIAQDMLRVLNMAPPNQASPAAKLWFRSPWEVEKLDSKHLAYQPSAMLQPGTDGDAECERQRLQSGPEEGVQTVSNSNPDDVLEADLEGDDGTCLSQLEEETKNVFAEVINDHEVQVSSSSQPAKILPVVTYEGHSIYKSTLVSQLNGNPYLSKDRLTRMKNSIYFNNSDDYLAAASSTSSMLLGLGCDVGVYFKDGRGTANSSALTAARKRKRGRPAVVNSGANKGIFYIGRVQKMRMKVGNKWGICRQPIDLMKRAVQNGNRGSVTPTAMVYFHWFKKVGGRNKYKYDESDCLWVDIDAVISTVSLSYANNTKIYTLDEVDANSLKEFIDNHK